MQGCKYLDDFHKRKNISFFEVDRKNVIRKKLHLQYYNNFIFKKRSKPITLAFIMHIKESKALQISV